MRIQDHMGSRLVWAFVAGLSVAGCGSTGSPTSPSAADSTAGPSAFITETFSTSVSNPGTTSIQHTLRLTANPLVTTPVTTTVSCAASGGATCPPDGDLVGVNLYTDGISYSVSPGGTLSFSITLTH